jgi:hypothetical protein
MGVSLVDIALVEINSSVTGSLEMTTLTQFNVTKNDPKTPVKTMNRRRRAIGYTRGVPEFQVEIECALEFGSPEVDWDELQKSGELFLLAYERGDSGERRNLRDCVVADVSEPYTAEGETRMSVTIMALDEKGE